ncbi:hypothetical protein NB542_21140 [Vibrio parahaemolyticus]|nr:hypothetical protein [Vibrio parahaemolyticus]MCD6704480.1 hypothetical protein [Vibrio cholerae]MCR9330804.1 hypothetical protein [Vibrio parahaemolyticus]MCR9750411.1 hypothetical protein [Vibrio parahaemolyticus]MCR9788098.1 hypothetical protein [Vibrio parahaemolyticus]MCR9862585.1 hypothetical protein [Vibrio parahaemolyticus]
MAFSVCVELGGYGGVR